MYSPLTIRKGKRLQLLRPFTSDHICQHSLDCSPQCSSLEHITTISCNTRDTKKVSSTRESTCSWHRRRHVFPKIISVSLKRHKCIISRPPHLQSLPTASRPSLTMCHSNSIYNHGLFQMLEQFLNMCAVQQLLGRPCQNNVRRQGLIHVHARHLGNSQGCVFRLPTGANCDLMRYLSFGSMASS